MGKMRQTRRAMMFAKHDVSHVTGKVERMTCRACGESFAVGAVTVTACKATEEKPDEGR